MSYQVREVAVPKHLHEEANVAFYGDELVYFAATPVAVLDSGASASLVGKETLVMISAVLQQRD